MPGLTGWTLNGLDLRTLAYDIRLTSGWDGWPGMKTQPFDGIYMHGQRSAAGKQFYRSRDIFLHMVIQPRDPVSGAVVSSEAQHIEENIDTLMAALHSPTGSAIPLVRTLAGGGTRTAYVRPISNFEVDGRDRNLVREFTIVLLMEYPFWHGEAIEASSSPVNNPGNAPVNDMILTFNSAGTVVVDGVTVESLASGLQLDVGAREVISAHDDADWSSDAQWILELQPGNNVVSGTASFTMSFNAGWF